MADKIRVNYAALEEMAAQCQTVSDRLSQLSATVNKSSSQMQGGSLVGQPGDAFVAALAILVQKVNKLSEKFKEEAQDIKQAESDMQQADTNAGNPFQ